MQNDYEIFVQSNRQLLVDTARSKDVFWNIDDLSNISAPQFLVNMMADEFLDAIKEELISLQEIKNVYAGLLDFYITYITEHPNTHVMFEGVRQPEDRYILEGTGWANVQAEQAMCLLFRQLITESSLDALRARTYDMRYVLEHARNFGPKAVYLIDLDFLTAFDEQRITMNDVRDMSCEALDTAISENRYPQDVSYTRN